MKISHRLFRWSFSRSGFLPLMIQTCLAYAEGRQVSVRVFHPDWIRQAINPELEMMDL